MSVIGSNILAGASGQGGYFLTNSLRFRSSATAYLSRTPASAGNRRTWTYSIWFKQGKLDTCAPFLGYWQNATIYNSELFLESTQNDATRQLKFYDYDGTSQFSFATTQSFRDVSAWYHLMVAFDSTQATDTNRVKIYLNGSQITSFSTTIYPSQNFQCNVFNNNITHWIGYNAAFGGGNAFDGYLTEVNFVDGLALTPSSFGETSTTTGVWIPKKYIGTYGTNGFYLPFTNTTSTSTLGTDFSGNSNTWTVNNISLTAGSTYDSMTDVPTLTSATAANYCVLNPISRVSTVASVATITNGNLDISTTTSDTRSYATFGFPTSGKYYYELTNNNSGSKGQGIASYDAGGDTYQVLYFGDGNKRVDGTTTSYGASYTTNDVIGVAVDIDNNQITFYKNNTSQGAISYTFSGKPTMFPYVRREASTDASYSFNFGQRPFSYTPPSGFVALNTFNLPTPTIGATASTQAGKYFNPVLYTGNGSTQSVTGVGFKPDLTWVKVRSSTQNHSFNDAVRGAGYYLVPNATAAERFQGEFDSFDTDGFSLTYDGAEGDYNASTKTYVAWNWRASNTTAVSNTNGSITSTVSANTSAGFSIVTFTGNATAGATVGHGLGVAPQMMFVKSRNNTYNWCVYAKVANSGNGQNGGFYLNLTDAWFSDSGFWNNTTAGASTFTLGSGFAVNGSGATFVAYCFAQVAGYSAFGSYTGNGSSDGTFVYTNFAPSFVMVKRTDTTGNWFIIDNKRLGYNGGTKNLYPNLSNAEATLELDLVSNGFKWRLSGADVNASGGTYIYMAFCESPFKFSNAR